MLAPATTTFCADQRRRLTGLKGIQGHGLTGQLSLVSDSLRLLSAQSAWGSLRTCAVTTFTERRRHDDDQRAVGVRRGCREAPRGRAGLRLPVDRGAWVTRSQDRPPLEVQAVRGRRVGPR